MLDGPKFQRSDEPPESVSEPAVRVPIPPDPGVSAPVVSMVTAPPIVPVPPRAPVPVTSTLPDPVAESVALLARSVTPLTVVEPP